MSPLSFRRRLLLPALAAAVLAAAPASAEWVHRQSDGFARADYDGGRYDVQLSCRKGRGFEFTVSDETLRGDEMEGVTGVMMWVTLPDGRTDRWPIDVAMEGPSLSGTPLLSDFSLEFFRNGVSFRVDAPRTGTVFVEGDLRGSGAARLAFRERCGL